MSEVASLSKLQRSRGLTSSVTPRFDGHPWTHVRIASTKPRTHVLGDPQPAVRGRITSVSRLQRSRGLTSSVTERPVVTAPRAATASTKPRTHVLGDGSVTQNAGN